MQARTATAATTDALERRGAETVQLHGNRKQEVRKKHEVRRTFMAWRASPEGFSANSVMLASSSIFMRPKAPASASLQGRQPIVQSAPLRRWYSTNFM